MHEGDRAAGERQFVLHERSFVSHPGSLAGARDAPAAADPDGGALW